jgi:nucleotide-binding universal stress UspA family protein
VRILVWVREGVWEAAVDAARQFTAADAEFILLHVISGDSSAVIEGGFDGLLGRRHRLPPALHDVESEADRSLLAAAEERLGHPAEHQTRGGRVEREVVLAAADADLLVVSRDGDRRRLGPHSLGPAARFVVDHAPCPVLLVWPERVPEVSSIPPPPPGPPKPAPPAHPNPG